MFDRAPVRFGARVALSELAFGAAVSLGGAGSVAVGAWLLVERGGEPTRIAERSAVLFLLTSAINVITLALAGLGAVGRASCRGPAIRCSASLQGWSGVVVFVFFLLLPRFSERLAAGRSPGKLRTLLVEVASTIRLTEQVLFTGDWRIVGAIAFLWCDIGVLAACFAAAGQVPPLAAIVLAYQIGYLSNLLPVPGNIGVLDGSLVGMFVLYGVSATLGDRRDGRLPRDRPVDSGDVGHGRLPDPAPHPRPPDQPAPAARGAPPAAQGSPQAACRGSVTQRVSPEQACGVPGVSDAARVAGAGLRRAGGQ